MALPPTIPTSFVPKQPVVTRRTVTSFNPFLFISYVIFGVWVLAGLGIFAYQLYLAQVAKSSTDKVAQAQSDIDQATVDEFIRTRDRFDLSKGVLEKHIVLSQLFDNIEGVTVLNARYSKLKVTVDDARNGKIEISGTAKNFNALAAQSGEYTANPAIKNAIFSGFQLDSKSGQVNFQINADVDTSLIMQTVAEAGAAPAVATPGAAVQPVGGALASTTKP